MNAFMMANTDRLHLIRIISPITKAILLLIFLRVPAASLCYINIILNLLVVGVVVILVVIVVVAVVF